MSNAPKSQAELDEEERQKRFEKISGLTLAVFAAALAIADLGGGKYGDDEIIGTNEKASAYAWYQSKSLKQTVLEQQHSLLDTLLSAKAISAEATPGVQAQLAHLSEEIKRYKVERAEILKGSAAVGPAGQVLEVDGQKGQIPGAETWDARLEVLGAAGDQFDLATLCLQLCLVLGAIGLVVQAEAFRWTFYRVTVVLGLLGSGFTAYAFSIALSAP